MPEKTTLGREGGGPGASGLPPGGSFRGALPAGVGYAGTSQLR